MVCGAPRRATPLCCLCFFVALVSGCNSAGRFTPWWEGYSAAHSTEHLKPDDAIAIAIFAGAGLVIHAGAAAVEGVVRCLRGLDFSGQPGVAYDSPEGRALRIPNYSAR